MFESRICRRISLCIQQIPELQQDKECEKQGQIIYIHSSGDFYTEEHG